MIPEEMRERIKQYSLENRLRLVKVVAVTATMVAVYYIGKNNGALQVNFYSGTRENLGEVQKSFKLR